MVGGKCCVMLLVMLVDVACRKYVAQGFVAREPQTKQDLTLPITSVREVL